MNKYALHHEESVPSTKVDKSPKIKATWKKQDSLRTEHVSEHSTFYDPTPYVKTLMPKKTESEKISDLRANMGKEALKRLETMASKKYGNLGNMLKMFNKKSEDKMTLEEFSRQLVKRNLDIYCSREDQRVIFELMDKDNSGSIPVHDLLSYSNTHDMNDKTFKLLEIRANIAATLAQRRNAAKLVESAKQQDLSLRRDLRNLDPDSTGYLTKDVFKEALGPKYLDLKLSDDEINLMFTELEEKRGDKVYISYDGFTKYLGTVNIDPNMIPFFDAKANLLTGLKMRKSNLENQATDTNRLNHIEHLRSKLENYDRQLTEEETMLASRTSPVLKHRFNASTDSWLSYKGYAPGEGEFGGLGAPQPSGTLSRTYPSPGGLLPSLVRTAPELQRAYNPKDPENKVGHKSNGNSSQQLQSSSNQYKSLDMSSMSDSMAVYTHMLELPSGPSLEDFIPHSTTAARTRMKDSTMVVAPPVLDITLDKQIIEGRRHYDKECDWSRIGVGGSGQRTYGEVTALECDPSIRYITTNSIYQSYDRISDAELSSITKAEQRRKRLERTNRSIEINNIRDEYQNLLAEQRRIRRAENSAKQALRYESALYLEDMKKFEKMPLEHMQVKMNKAQYDRMWGSQSKYDGPENRVFETTASSSFIRSPEKE